jgi:hypothetical protein
MIVSKKRSRSLLTQTQKIIHNASSKMFLYFLSVLLLAIHISVIKANLPLQFLKAFDVSKPQSQYNPDFWLCTYNAGYQKVIIRGLMVMSPF